MIELPPIGKGEDTTVKKALIVSYEKTLDETIKGIQALERILAIDGFNSLEIADIKNTAYDLAKAKQMEEYIGTFVELYHTKMECERKILYLQETK